VTGTVSSDLADVERLGPYLADRLGSDYGSFTVERLGEGQSCLTFRLAGVGWSLVLRRPPRGDLPSTAYDVSREFRVMSALRSAGSKVPIPEPLLLCEDRAVIGAHFYVMTAVDGLVLRSAPPDAMGDAAKTKLGVDLVDVLASLHSTDWRVSGLEGFGRAENYAERQLGRMDKLWQGYQFRDSPEVEALGQWLHGHIPREGIPGIVHGDYKLDNVIVDIADGRVVALVDWELSTIGDPIADLGWLLYYWLDDAGEATWPNMPQAMLGSGFPRRTEIVKRYLDRRDVDPGAVMWYAALAGWKSAVMLEGSYRRYVAGITDVPGHAALEQGVPFLARRGLDFAGGFLAI
jgi:aminoglycoside phosphotransferase (APT) family kinase protein